MTINRQLLIEKWSPVLDAPNEAAVKGAQKRGDIAVLLENMEQGHIQQLNEAGTPPVNNSGATLSTGAAGGTTPLAGFDPILISLVRRAVPQMIAYDIAGVQPLSMPTGLIFAMKSKYSTQGGTEALFDQANTAFSGTGTQTEGDGPTDATYSTGTGMSASAGEELGSSGGGTFGQMAFSIEKTVVEAKTRALKAEYSLEIEQDLRAVHGLEAESELSTILTTEILGEINRELIRTVYIAAKAGCVSGTTTTAGTFDLDVDSSGRWSVEKFKGLMFQIEREANVIQQLTRRGRGNFIICSADVASALSMAGVLDYAPAISANLDTDTSQSCFAGVLNGKYKVFVDPFSANGGANPQYFVVGFKGVSAMDAGLFYCPYVPLQKVRAIDPDTFQPKIGFKTRYGLISNPFTAITAGNNIYFRKVRVLNIM